MPIKPLQKHLHLHLFSILPVSRLPVGLHSIEIENIYFTPELEALCCRKWQIATSSLRKVKFGKVYDRKDSNVSSNVSRFKLFSLNFSDILKLLPQNTLDELEITSSNIKLPLPPPAFFPLSLKTLRLSRPLFLDYHCGFLPGYLTEFCLELYEYGFKKLDISGLPSSIRVLKIFSPKTLLVTGGWPYMLRKLTLSDTILEDEGSPPGVLKKFVSM
jgi:hypothetical protein